jgi:uncharacterized repeat protein (TIGR04076 family)
MPGKAAGNDIVAGQQDMFSGKISDGEDGMRAVKITVLKRTLHSELAKANSNTDVRMCEVFTEGQEFISKTDMPEGFCPWAWNDISRVVLALYAGGSFDQGTFKNWMKESNTMVVCCTDGLRPVSFKIERIDTKTLIDVAGIEQPAPSEVYDSERWGEFSYVFLGLEAGERYQVRLHFCEVYHGRAGMRCFNVELGGKRVLENFDILANAGAKYKPVVKDFTAAADKGGFLTIDFIKGAADFAKVSAIEIIKPEKGSAGKAVYAVNAGGGACGAFSADNFFKGGNTVSE